MGIELDRKSCGVVGLDRIGKVVVRRLNRRETVIAYASMLLGSAHGTDIGRQGHSIRLILPTYVRSYFEAQKNDDRNAAGIAEAATRPTLLFVELKTEEQLKRQTLHRIRNQLFGSWTLLTSQISIAFLNCDYLVPLS
ncbi:hypothetical protein NHF48_022715 [Sphingomonas sp. H160509]|uniref:hypothetical protein n=1 Tax=Sphingomonas sp. H160509 TaxID=2955313 RepID=UPI0020979AF5|nr:hypothetical protein [Sphingomonas sp. H160509]MDD1453097.1 hypothetical protein [Sphingomonas sp. H160509]